MHTHRFAGRLQACSSQPHCPCLTNLPPSATCTGLDGCSAELGVLKKSRATTTNARMAPRALLLELAESVKLVSAVHLAGWLPKAASELFCCFVHRCWSWLSQ